MEAFSLRKIVEMLEKVVVSWQKVRWIWQMRQNFIAQFIQLLKIYIFNWRVIALQYCVGFCHTSTWINHGYTGVPSLLNLLPSTTSHPSRLSHSTGLSSPRQNSCQAVYGTEFWSFNSFYSIKSPKLVLKENLGYAWYSFSVQFCSEGQCLTQFAYTNLHDYFINVYFTQLKLW